MEIKSTLKNLRGQMCPIIYHDIESSVQCTPFFRHQSCFLNCKPAGVFVGVGADAE